MRARCGGCGLPLALGARRCSDCIRLAPPQHHTVVAVDYDHPWDRLIQQLKFAAAPELAASLALLLTFAVKQSDSTGANPAELVIPVPLSPQRLRQRGYNQAWEVGRRVARRLRLPASPQALQRWVDLPGQALQGRESRLDRLRGVFGVPAAYRSLVAGRHVAVVDDVYTTGATAAEAVRALQAAGAARVSIWAVARTPPPADSAS